MAHRLADRSGTRRDARGGQSTQAGGWWWVLILGLVSGLLLYLFPL